MKKRYIVLGALLAVIVVYGFERTCESIAYGEVDPKATYSVSYFGPSVDMPTRCDVTLTQNEKDFIREALKRRRATTKITRKFYLKEIKTKYDPAKKGLTKEQVDEINALRRVVKDFGGSKKRDIKQSPERTVGDIRNMLDGKLQDLGVVQIQD